MRYLSLLVQFIALPLILYLNYAGIGAACAIALAEAGASICLVQREPASGVSPNLATFDTIRALKVKVEVVYCDLADLEATKGVFQKALDVMDEIHILVNCAGIQRRSPSIDFAESDWDDVSVIHPVHLFTTSQH
jgi:2-deoxy-D-gluconate 3-dehydrogenase